MTLAGGKNLPAILLIYFVYVALVARKAIRPRLSLTRLAV
jgi:hypothetical protein